MWLYHCLLMAITPIVLLKIVSFKRKCAHYRAKEAFGFWPVVEADLWIHCASVGEVLAVRSFVAAWRVNNLNKSLLITTMTPTGAEQVVKVFPFAQHRYLPVDWSWAMKKVFTKIRCPHLLIVETELWPNLLQQAKRKKLRVDVINARMSASSFQRYKKFSIVSQPLFSLPDSFFAHAPADAERFTKLGAKKVLVTGSIKFDLSVPEGVFKDNWQAQVASPFVWVGGSTHQGEDDILLRAHKQVISQKKGALLVLVPRHPERFNSVFALAKSHFDRVALRSEVSPEEWSNFDVVIGDSMGELMYYYQAANVVFVGGSLIERGGHNPIEPALLSKAILVGVHTFNFLDITEQLVEMKGAIVCGSEVDLIERLMVLLERPEQSVQIGQAAYNFAKSNQGAVERVLAEIDFQ